MKRKLFIPIILSIILAIGIGSYKFYHSEIFQRNIFPEKYWTHKIKTLNYTKQTLENINIRLLVDLELMGNIKSRDLIILSVLNNKDLNDTVDNYINGIQNIAVTFGKIQDMIIKTEDDLNTACNHLRKYKPNDTCNNTLDIPEKVTLIPVE